VFLSSVLEAVNRFLGYVEDYQIGGRPEAVIFSFRQSVITALRVCVRAWEFLS
jgi:hypothetical protein